MKITKNKTVLDVTKGSYEALFKRQGWKPCKGREPDGHRNSTNMMPQPNGNADMPFSDIVNSSPAGFENMTNKQLVEYAEKKGIDIEGATRKNEIIDLIQKAMGS